MLLLVLLLLSLASLCGDIALEGDLLGDAALGPPERPRTLPVPGRDGASLLANRVLTAAPLLVVGLERPLGEPSLLPKEPSAVVASAASTPAALGMPKGRDTCRRGASRAAASRPMRLCWRRFLAGVAGLWCQRWVCSWRA